MADMTKGGTGEATGVIREERKADGTTCYVVTIDNPNGSREHLHCVCDTYEHAQKLLNIGQLEI